MISKLLKTLKCHSKGKGRFYYWTLQRIKSVITKHEIKPFIYTKYNKSNTVLTIDT